MEDREMSDYLTTAEAAEKVRVSPCTITRLIRTGAIRAEKAGRRWLIEPDELKRWMDAQTRAAHRRLGLNP